jgi:hypothetical protein
LLNSIGDTLGNPAASVNLNPDFSSPMKGRENIHKLAHVVSDVLGKNARPMTVLEWSDDQYAWRRRMLARCQTFFRDIQALMHYMVFDS